MRFPLAFTTTVLSTVMAGSLAGVPLQSAPADAAFPPGVTWQADATLAAPPEPTVTLAAVGDLSFGRSVRARLEAHPGDDPLAGLAPFLSSADIAIANLESSVVSPDKEGFYMLRAPAVTPTILAQAGLDLVSVANNHAFDGGEDAYRASIAAVRKAGVIPVGDAAYGADEVAVVERNGVKVGFVAMTALSNAGAHALTFATPETIAARVAEAKKRTDVVVAYVHAGTEYRPVENDLQRSLAHAAIDAGASLYLGAHPHVVEPMERYKDGLIFYSLGNTVFDQGWNPPAMRSIAVRVTLDRHGVRAADAFGITIQNGTYRPSIDKTDDARSALRNLGAYPETRIMLDHEVRPGRMLLMREDAPVVAELRDGVLRVRAGDRSLLETTPDWRVQQVFFTDSPSRDLGVLIWRPTADGYRQRLYLSRIENDALVPLVRDVSFANPLCDVSGMKDDALTATEGRMTHEGADCSAPAPVTYRWDGSAFSRQ